MPPKLASSSPTGHLLSISLLLLSLFLLLLLLLLLLLWILNSLLQP